VVAEPGAGWAARYGGEGATVSSVGRLSPAVAAAPYVELGLEVLWGDSSPMSS
jgi:hypothetical protein